MNKTLSTEIAPVPFDRVSRLIRQLTHDVRNGLSAIDLEAAFISELVEDPEALDELRKLRTMVSNSATMLRDLSQNFQEVNLHQMPWSTGVFYGELQSRLFKQYPGETDFHVTPLQGEGQVDIDLELLCGAISAFVANAFYFREKGAAVTLAGRVAEGTFTMELREVKSALESEVPPEEWGQEPFKSTRPGGYGLGLFRARRIIDAHGGQVSISFQDGELLSVVTIPLL